MRQPRKKAVCPAPPRTRRRSGMFPPTTFYPKLSSCELVVFDTCVPKVAKHCSHEQAEWWQYADAKMLDLDYLVLKIELNSVREMHQ